MTDVVPQRERVDAVLARLGKLHPKVIDLSLGRIERLLAALGDPHLKGPPVIHVAGTNGKGSVVALMRALLEASGHSVHTYTSPHLVRFAERIRLAGQIIDEVILEEILKQVEDANGDHPITFFEITTAAAFLAMSHVPADAVLLETGLGGRLDATNVVPKPLATVITTIGIDHQSYLGDTIREIAGEKAAIMKPGVPSVTAAQLPDAADVLAAYAKKVNASLSIEGEHFSGVIANGKFTFESPAQTFSAPAPNLVGAHQATNTALAIEALLKAGFPLPAFAVRSAMRNVTWPARLQRITEGPLYAAVRPGAELWLDGGHNESAGYVLGSWLEQQGGRTAVIAGMMNTKHPRTFLSAMVPHISELVAVPVPDQPNGASPDTISIAASDLGCTASVAPNVAAAIADLADRQLDRILICGSLYLAGDVLAQSGFRVV